MNNGKTIDLSSAVVFVDGVEIGTFESINTTVHLPSSDKLIRKRQLKDSMWFYTEALYYSNHSKKRIVITRKLKQVIAEYKDLNQKEENQ